MEGSYNKALEENPNKPNRLSDDMLLNRFANEFYQHLRPSKHMTTNDIAQYITDFLDKRTKRFQGDDVLNEIANAMERWHLARDNDDETLKTINDILYSHGYLKWFNEDNKGTDLT